MGTTNINKSFLTEQFESVFGPTEKDSIRTFFAPGSLVFCGEHNDYNGGMVLPCALTLGTYSAIKPRKDTKIRVYTSISPEDGIQEFSALDQFPRKAPAWINYIQGAVWSMIAHGHRLTHGFDIYYYSNLPTNAGLGSSATIIVLTIFSITKMMELDKQTRQDMALVCKDAKTNFLEIPGGLLASFASLMGKKDHALFFATSGLHYKYVPLPLTLSKARIIIANSHKNHDLDATRAMLAERKKECQEGYRILSNVVFIKSLCTMDPDIFETYKDIISYPNIVKRVRHLVYENERTYQAFNALNVGNLEKFGKVLNESYESLRDNYETSCPEVDTLVAAAMQCPGVIASRMTGIGIGGCTLNIVMEENIYEFIQTVGSKYKDATGIEATFFIADIGDGAHELLD